MNDFKELFVIIKGSFLCFIIWFLDKIYIQLNLLMFTGSRFYEILEDLRPLIAVIISVLTAIYMVYKIVKIHKEVKKIY